MILRKRLAIYASSRVGSQAVLFADKGPRQIAHFGYITSVSKLGQAYLLLGGVGLHLVLNALNRLEEVICALHTHL